MKTWGMGNGEWGTGDGRSAIAQASFLIPPSPLPPPHAGAAQ
jgi:hypothetical protein